MAKGWSEGETEPRAGSGEVGAGSPTTMRHARFYGHFRSNGRFGATQFDRKWLSFVTGTAVIR
jgi:hypothetical protein